MSARPVPNDVGRPGEPSGRREFGERGEEDGRSYLEDLGFCFIARNERFGAGELDLIVSDGRVLVFAEVKARHVHRGSDRVFDHGFGWPSARQRMRQRAAARMWLADASRVRPRTPEVRFDVLRILFDQDERLVDIQHLEGV